MAKFFQKVPAGWNVKLIPEVLFFQEGPGVRKTQFRDSGVKLLNVGNINSQQLDLSTTSLYISEEEAYGKYKHFIVDAGDLLIACSGIVVDNFHNKMAYAEAKDLPLCMNTSTMRFKVHQEKEIIIDYYRYFLQTNLFKAQLGRLITGSAQLNFGPSHIKQIEIPLPPLETQKKIAAILDKADELRRNDQKILEKYDQLTRSVFLEMFGDPVTNQKGWELKNIRKSSLIMSDGPFGSNLKSEHYRDKGVRVIRLQNIGINKFNDTDQAYISEQHYETIKKHTCKPGDVIAATLGDPNLRACRFPVTLEKAINKADCIQIRPNPSIIDDTYLVNLINIPATLHLVSHLLHGQTRTRISMGQLSTINLPIPPLKLQKKFTEIFEYIETQKLYTKKSLQKSEELFQSLLQKAFRGELS